MPEEQGASSALVSVVMSCCGQLEYTRLSAPRVLRYSRPPFQVLFLDAGSLDGTAECLACLAGAAPLRVEVVRGERGSDLTLLVPQALTRARGRFIAWVHNDVLVPDSWLQQQLALVLSGDTVGVVGPMANVAPE